MPIQTKKEKLLGMEVGWDSDIELCQPAPVTQYVFNCCGVLIDNFHYFLESLTQ